MVRRRRRWHRVTWWYSLLLVVPLVLIGADRLFGISPVDDNHGASAATVRDIAFYVTDAASGQVIAGAEVRVGDAAAQSDEQGVASLQLQSGEVIVTAIFSYRRSSIITKRALEQELSTKARHLMRRASVGLESR